MGERILGHQAGHREYTSRHVAWAVIRRAHLVTVRYLTSPHLTFCRSPLCTVACDPFIAKGAGERGNSNWAIAP